MDKPIAKVELIDLIQRLGLSYHFELMIDELLQQIHDTYVKNNRILIIQTELQDLYFLALLFKLLRQEGYPISAGMRAYILL